MNNLNLQVTDTELWTSTAISSLASLVALIWVQPTPTRIILEWIITGLDRWAQSMLIQCNCTKTHQYLYRYIYFLTTLVDGESPLCGRHQQDAPLISFIFAHLFSFSFIHLLSHRRISSSSKGPMWLRCCCKLEQRPEATIKFIKQSQSAHIDCNTFFFSYFLQINPHAKNLLSWRHTE